MDKLVHIFKNVFSLIIVRHIEELKILKVAKATEN